jgi:hypothetical protein
VSRDFRPSVFFRYPGSPDSWAKTVLHIDSNSWRSSTKFDENNRLRAMPLPWGRQDHLWPIFWKTVTLTASVKAERILFWLSARVETKTVFSFFVSTLLPAMRKKLRALQHSGESIFVLNKFFYLRLSAMRQCAESIFVVEFSRRSPRIQIYLQNRFSPWIRGPKGTV